MTGVLNADKIKYTSLANSRKWKWERNKELSSLTLGPPLIYIQERRVDTDRRHRGWEEGGQKSRPRGGRGDEERARATEKEQALVPLAARGN